MQQQSELRLTDFYFEKHAGVLDKIIYLVFTYFRTLFVNVSL